MEIIETENPNIVIQRSINEIPINLEELSIEKSNLESQVDGIEKELTVLNSIRVPKEIDTLVRIEIDTLNIAKQGINDRLDYINDILCHS